MAEFAKGASVRRKSDNKIGTLSHQLCADYWAVDFCGEESAQAYRCAELAVVEMPPTTWEIFRRLGIKAVLQMKLERICVRVIGDMHRDAREHGHNLVRPGYKTPWWFKIVSKLEFWCRP